MYDPDIFDAEILLERKGFCGPDVTTSDLMRLFGVQRSAVNRAVSRGRMIPPQFPGNDHSESRWTVEQVASMLADGRYPRFRPNMARVQIPKPIEHGTMRGYWMEKRRGVSTCRACRDARIRDDYQRKQRRMAAAAS